MIEGCFGKHRTRHVARVVLWLAPAAVCLAGCATQARRVAAPPPTAGMASPPAATVVPARDPGADADAPPIPTLVAMPPALAGGVKPGGPTAPPEFELPPLPSPTSPMLGTRPGGRVAAGGDEAPASDPADAVGPRLVRLDDEGKPLPDQDVRPVACATCGDFHLSDPAFPGGCGAGGCIPGRQNRCYPTEHVTFIGRFFENLYQCLCCPDPCYEPTWIPTANAAFFVDPARPRTYMRLRWDAGQTLWFPDRSEYFWARSFRGPGPQPKVPVTKNGRPVYGERTLNYDQLPLYMEAATQRFSFFTEFPYRTTFPLLTPHHAGFSDMNLGTKSLLLDCDLIQFTLQFRTYIPMGSVTSGLGNGHVSLEPSFLMALHLAPETYFQGQLAEWIPLGGDPQYAGAILHYHLSLNHTLCRIHPDVPLIGTLEFNGWSFQDGAFTAPLLGPQRSAGASYFSLGPGLRMSVCKNIDFGIGTAFSLSSPSFGDSLIRSEVRIFY